VIGRQRIDRRLTDSSDDAGQPMPRMHDAASPVAISSAEHHRLGAARGDAGAGLSWYQAIGPTGQTSPSLAPPIRVPSRSDSAKR
jgi:hypothetical protein